MGELWCYICPVRCLTAPMVAEGGSYDMDIEPDDIEVSDTVTVLWEIG